METKVNSTLLRLRGRPLNPLLITSLLLLNIFLVIFPSSSSFNLDFFVIFSFLVLTFEFNKNEESLIIRGLGVPLTNFNRNLIFLLISALLLVTISLNWFWFIPPVSDEFMGKLAHLERVGHLFVSIVLMFILYKTILIDFSILITIVLFANLIYHLALKNILEVFLDIDYLKFLFQGQDIRKEIQTLLNNTNKTPGIQKPLWENSSLNQMVLETLLTFIGTLNNIFNTFYFIILTKIIGGKMLHLNIRLSQIYFPKIFAWVFIMIIAAFLVYSQFFSLSSIISKNVPYWAKLTGEIIISGLASFIFLYLIQGFSILFAYFKEQNFLGKPILNFPFLVFISLTLVITLILKIEIMIWINLFLISLMTMGFTDTWIHYRKHYRYQNFLTD